MPQNKFFKLIIQLVPVAVLASGIAIVAAGCNKPKATPPEVQAPPIAVKAQAASTATTLSRNFEFPATVAAEQEAKVIAKTSGSAKDVNFKLGDKVKLGDILVKVDDISQNGMKSEGFDANQIKQAQIGAEQARTSYEMARTNYLNLIQTAGKDLKQIEIAQAQAQTGKNNLETTTSEALKSAQLGYDTAKIAAEQSRLALENRKASVSQSQTDAETNSKITADSAVDSCNTIIVGLNGLAELENENGGNSSYYMNLGAMDQQTMATAKSAYRSARTVINNYKTNGFQDLEARINGALDVASTTKYLVDAMKKVVDNTVSSANLPQSSMGGVSISGMQGTVAGNQTQINGLMTQLNGVKQGLANLELNNDSTLDALQKAYELAQQQEKIAAQNLENLKAGNKSQQDQATFGIAAADNQYASTKSKLDTQISISKSQADLAELQYRNAVVSLQSLIDIHQTIAPIDGVITAKSVENGDTVSAGMVLAVISTPDRLKIKFFAGQEDLDSIVTGMDVFIKDNDGNTYPANVTAVTPAADPVTKRFLVEVSPKDQNHSAKFSLGSVTTVVVPVTKHARAGAYILPLAAVEVAQNGTSIYGIMNGDKVTKISVKIEKVDGEFAEVTAVLAEDSLIVVDGNKLVKEGQTVTVIQ